MTDGTFLEVVVFDTMEIIMSQVENEGIVCHSNIANSYDFWSRIRMKSIFMEKFSLETSGTQGLTFVGNNQDKPPVPLI